MALTRDELAAILLPEKPDDPAAVAAHEQRLTAYLPDINAAFEIMGIDTVEAQADYLAHTAGESGTMAKLAEVGAEKREYAPFQGRGPVQVTWESGYVQTLAYLETQAERLEQQAVEADAKEAGASGDGGAPAGGGATFRGQAAPRAAVEAIKRPGRGV
jgi:predicted chitinase